jgi:tetratricopeptide (TPR) repeat protein
MNLIFRNRARGLSLGLSLLTLLSGSVFLERANGQVYSGYPSYPSYGSPYRTPVPGYPGFPQPGYGRNPNYPSYSPPVYQQPSARPPQGSYGAPLPNNSYSPPPAPPPQTTRYIPVEDDTANQDDRIDEYAKYSEQAQAFFNKGQLTQAIEQFEKALAIAPEESIPVVYNNLAVVYMKRGNYYHDHGRQDEQAANDYRRAYFYLETAWPEGQERKPLHEKNRQVAKDNLNIAYRNLGINPADKNKHLELAKQLRMQGKFPEAIVEYRMALDLDKKDVVAAKALGDLFTVVNLPEKSKIYYAMAAEGAGAAPNAKGTLAEDEVLVQLGNAQYKTGEVDKAVANFDKALAINPNNVSALNMLEKIWLNEIKFNPTSVLGHANLGSVYQKKKMYDQAQQQYAAAENFAERDPKTPFETKKLIRLNMGTLFQAKKQYELAQKAYDTVLQVDPNHIQANFYKATLLEESGNLDAAVQAYNRVLSLDSNHKAAKEKMFALVKQQTDPIRLANGLKQYAERFSSDAAIQAQIGEEFHQRKDLENAAVYYQRAIRLNPNLASAWANLGAVYHAQGKEEESVNAFTKAQALEPNNDTFKELAKNAANSAGYKMYQEAVSLQQAGKTAEALDAYRKALEIADTPEIRAAYGIALQSDGKLPEAIAQYQKAIAKEPNNADYHYYLGTAFHQDKAFDKAKAEYQKALSLKADYPEAKDALASINQQVASQDLEKAIEAYNSKNYTLALTAVNKVLASNPQDAMAHYYKGLVLDAQKKPTLAVQSYREAVKHNPDFSDAYYALGVALDAAKDTKGARSAFEKFVSLSEAEDDFVKYAKERLKALSQTANF